MIKDTSEHGVLWSKVHFKLGANHAREGGGLANNPCMHGTHAYESWRAGFESEFGKKWNENDLAAIHARLGEKLEIGLEEAAITAYQVRPGFVSYEITHKIGGSQKVAWLTAQALSDLEESHRRR